MMGKGSKMSHQPGSQAQEDMIRAIQSGAVEAGILSYPRGMTEAKKLRETARAWQALNPATVGATHREISGLARGHWVRH